jgi:hypothetical protein
MQWTLAIEGFATLRCRSQVLSLLKTSSDLERWESCRLGIGSANDWVLPQRR